MTKYFLIHGYGKALDIGEPNIPLNGGFYTFDTEISAGEAYPFLWAYPYPRSWWKPYSLYHQLHLYYIERQRSETKELHSWLCQEIQEQQPSIIIAHSLGAHMLMSMMQMHSLPNSVKHIILVQADTHLLPSKNRDITIYNFYCWWDIALLSSTILHKKIPHGLRAVSVKGIQTHFQGLYKGWNLHQDIWRDTGYKEKIMRKINKM